MQLEERQLHSNCMAWFKEVKIHLKTLHNNGFTMENLHSCDPKTCLDVLRTQFKDFFDSKEVNASDFHNKCWKKDFKNYTRREPETYIRNLLQYLDVLDKLIDERVLKYGELQMKEREVQAIQEIVKRLKEREIQQQESLVTEGTTLEANLSTDGTTLDASAVIEGTTLEACLVTEGTTLEACLVTKGIAMDDNLVVMQSIVDSSTFSGNDADADIGTPYDSDTVSKTYQTLRMFPPKENSILNKAKELTPSLYSIDEMGQDLLSDHKIIFKEELKCEAEKRLKVKQRKSMLSYHGFVYGLTQFEEPSKVPLKRRDQEFFQTQFESVKSESHSHVYENEIFEQNSSLKNENRCLKKTITELSKQAADVKEEMTKRCAQYEKDFAKLEAHCTSLELKSQNKILTFVQNGQVLSNKSDEAKIKFDTKDLETINIELEYTVTSLLKENERLKTIYQNLFDSIKRSRVQTKSLNVSQNEAENLKSQLSEFADKKFDKVFQKINQWKRKKLGEKKILFGYETSSFETKIKELEMTLAQQTKDFEDAKVDFSMKTDKIKVGITRSNKKEYNELRISYNALKANFDVLNRDKGKYPISNSSTPKVSVSLKIYTDESSKSFPKRVSQFTTYSLQKDRKFSKKPQVCETPTSQKVLNSSDSSKKNQSLKTPNSCFTPVKQVWGPKQSHSKPFKYSNQKCFRYKTRMTQL
ncbi:hypothetical protein Tco_0230832 [Tanacetum coccineum]